MNIMFVTGMSGAGKTKAINALEDAGYFCMDNLPPRFLANFPELIPSLEQSGNGKAAIVVDVRGREMFQDFFDGLEQLKRTGIPYHILFLDAGDEVLLHRFKETRRRHPLLGVREAPRPGGEPGAGTEAATVQEAIARERVLLSGLRDRADFILDTSKTRSGQLKELVLAMADKGLVGGGLLVTCLSFGFRNGLPPEADLVFDVRCLPNPFYLPELREHTGKEACVRDYVMQFPESRTLFAKLEDLLRFLMPLYVQEGKSQLVIAAGCTGGRHRSVMTAERLGDFLKGLGYAVTVGHRDIDKPFAG